MMPLTLSVVPLVTNQDWLAIKATGLFNVRLAVARLMSRPEEPRLKVLPALMTIGTAGFKILSPAQLVFAPSALVAKAGLAAVMVESQTAMSPDPGATPPIHEVPTLRLPPVSLLVMLAAWADSMPKQNIAVKYHANTDIFVVCIEVTGVVLVNFFGFNWIKISILPLKCHTHLI